LINNFNSQLKPINIGVPQGFILGPLLFITYINDLHNATLTERCLFADDMCLVISRPTLSSLTDSCNRELENLKNWCNANALQINPSKSFVYQFFISKMHYLGYTSTLQ